MRWIAAVLMIVAVFASKAEAGACKQRGAPLTALINTSDAVGIIERSGKVEIDLLRGLSASRIEFRFVEFWKPALAATGGTTGEQSLFSGDGQPLPRGGAERYVAFLRYAGGDRWTVGRCSYLAITPSNQVLDACEAISDLFADRPYERERLCLLAYPPSADLQLLKQDVLKNIQNERRFSGHGRILAPSKWQEGAAYQQITFELDSKTRKEYLQSKLPRESIPLRAFLRSDRIDRRELERLTRSGRRFSFSGIWTMGSFIMEEFQ